MTNPKPTVNLAAILEDLSMFQTKTKDQAEFVITRYNESLTWAKGLEHLATVYNKGPTPIDISANSVIQVPNHGYGLESILRHIITNYNNLADVTMFCQATLVDRLDQPMYPLGWYFQDTKATDLKGVLTDSYDPPKSRFRSRLTDPKTFAIHNRTLREFRDRVVGIPYRYLVEMWVRGDWIAVGKELIRKKPYQYYVHLYNACQFDRGVIIEECWFLERSLWAIFTYPVASNFKYTPSPDVLLK